MVVELINTGSELLLGRVLNTHQQWLCRKLADLGMVVSRQVAVPDTGPDIELALREALSRAEIIIVTGGLGPTSDDLTRDYVARLLGRNLTQDPAIVAHIQAFFDTRKRSMPESTKVQALVPEGAIVLNNPNGTAPGLAIEVCPNPFKQIADPAWVVMLPGPPRELRPMFVESVVPLLRRILVKGEPFICKTFRTAGIGESIVEERLSPRLLPLREQGLELGYCARTGQVDVRCTARGAQAEEIVRRAADVVSAALSGYIYGEDDEEIEHAVVRALSAQGKTVCTAESCTGGLIANRITNVPGSSAVFTGGYVTYSDSMKQRLLGVAPAALEQHGAVSEPVACQMARGACSASGADYAIAVTGIAGPSGGSEAKPVGTVFIALTSSTRTVVMRNYNPYDRETFKQVTSQQALDLLRRELLSPAAAEQRSD